MPSTDYSSLPLTPELITTIQSLNYHKMTPIQAQSLPAILKGKDLLAQAKTGSGKTAAFCIGILHKLVPANYLTQALVLCPTRELAVQVSKEIRRLARAVPNTKILTLCGGTPIGPQLASLTHQPHIVVGTPGRILQHLDKTSLKLGNLDMLVLDEADRMLDMGFYDDIIRIISMTPRDRQTLLFSATYPQEIKAISDQIQNDPIDVRLQYLHDNTKIKQVFFEIKQGERTKALATLLKHYRPASSLIFCNRKQQCQELADLLTQQGFHALAIHGDLEQQQRDQVLVQFSNKSCSVLIATDVAARGLDILDLDAVINFEISPDPQVHIHRIGRTGRANNEGLAISIYMASEHHRIIAIEKLQNNPVVLENINICNTTAPHIRHHVICRPAMVTLCINGGRKHKIRAGDILGALTANTELPATKIGKIDIFDKLSYIAVERSVVNLAVQILVEGKIKGRKFRSKKLC